jgi:hypothetical protein
VDADGALLGTIRAGEVVERIEKQLAARRAGAAEGVGR